MNDRPANRLIHEKSPYLLQHARNPVDWFAWGPPAFELARREDKPIILSIGYSTCHWCHVMEHESFENEAIAKLMNDHFVSIKVDREERPDLDAIYMTAVSAMTGQGGWPLTVFLTPDQIPFYGGTYFPPHARWGSPGFTELLNAIHHSWTTDRPRILESSQEIQSILQKHFSRPSEKEELNELQLDQAFLQLQGQFDNTFGGFSQAPKFPMGHSLSFLLRYWKRTGNNNALVMTTTTLAAMAQGGMYDQIGGGFHRYSTDQKWHVPHFEKMLYDQALLIRAYLEAYQATREQAFADVARDVINYVVRDLKDPLGGFYSAEDADSLEEGPQEPSGAQAAAVKREGAFYVWSVHELKTVLGDHAALAAYYFGAEESGNAEFDPHHEFVGKNILFRPRSIAQTAEHFKLSLEQTQQIIDDVRQKLFQKRLSRPRPHLDDKILTDWNGLMISSLACAAQVLNDESYKNLARGAADFILKTLVNPQGRLLHRYRDHSSDILGTLEDYAFFILGLLDLYEATFDSVYIVKADFFAEEMLKLFWDEANGGFFLTAVDAETLIVRPKEIYDGAIPSGNSVAALVLNRLYYLTSKEIWLAKAQSLIGSFAGMIKARPSAYTMALSSLDFMLSQVSEIALVGDFNRSEFNVMNHVIHQKFYPSKVITGYDPGRPDHVDMRAIIPALEQRPSVKNTIAAYVCQDHACRQPVFSPTELAALLTQLDDRGKT